MKWRNTKEREMMKSRHNQQKVEKAENLANIKTTIEGSKSLASSQLSIENLTSKKVNPPTSVDSAVLYQPTNISLNCCKNNLFPPKSLHCEISIGKSTPNSSLYVSSSSFNSLSSSASSSLSPISIVHNSHESDSQDSSDDDDDDEDDENIKKVDCSSSSDDEYESKNNDDKKQNIASENQ
jgi:hypothetical protein